MENLGFTFEVVVIGFIVVMVSLFLMALVLMLFERVVEGATRKNITAAPIQAPVQTPVHEDEVTEEEEQGAEVYQETIGQEVAFDQGPVQPEIAAAISGVFQCMNRPEIVAAAMGALFYITGPPQDASGQQPHQGLWGDAGRTSSVDLRQDHSLLRRGKM